LLKWKLLRCRGADMEVLISTEVKTVGWVGKITEHLEPS